MHKAKPVATPLATKFVLFLFPNSLNDIKITDVLHNFYCYIFLRVFMAPEFYNASSQYKKSKYLSYISEMISQTHIYFYYKNTLGFLYPIEKRSQKKNNFCTSLAKNTYLYVLRVVKIFEPLKKREHFSGTKGKSMETCRFWYSLCFQFLSRFFLFFLIL